MFNPVTQEAYEDNVDRWAAAVLTLGTEVITRELGPTALTALPPPSPPPPSLAVSLPEKRVRAERILRHARAPMFGMQISGMHAGLKCRIDELHTHIIYRWQTEAAEG